VAATCSDELPLEPGSWPSTEALLALRERTVAVADLALLGVVDLHVMRRHSHPKVSDDTGIVALARVRVETNDPQRERNRPEFAPQPQPA
jgi:hypothetical protein